MKTVRKRNGQKVAFNKEKIVNAILGAMEDTGKKDKEIAEKIATLIEEEKTTNNTVEHIQDMVEDYLIEFGCVDAAKAYIRYRYKHQVARDNYTEFMDAITVKLDASDVQGQNANVDERSFGGRIGEATNLMMKKYALDNCMSDMARNNHLNNEIYIHDLDHYAVGCHNCLTIPFDDLLAKGFKVRQTDIRPAGSVDTALQLVAVIFQLQSLVQFGGVAASHLDWTMVPYVRKSFFKHWRDGRKFILKDENANELKFNENLSIDDEYYKDEVYEYALTMTEKEVKQGCESLYHNLNTLQSRSGSQLPFTSINYGTCTLPEGRMVIKALLEGSLDGTGKYHRTPIFPCGIFQVGEGINKHPGDPNYDLFKLALKSTSKRLYPNYANIDWSVNKGYDKDNPCTYTSTMGCRTYNGFDINGLGYQKDGRGNLAPVTVILPTLAMEANRDVEKFMELLDQKIHEARDMLIERYKLMCKQSPKSAQFMYDNGTMAGYDGENVESALKHGTLVIGSLGLAEALQLLVGCDHTEPEGMELAKRIYKLYNERCAQFKKDLSLNFGVYLTPAENLCYTAMKKFKEKYGEIPNVSDRDYFTNSTHVPVWKEITAFEKINIEAELAGYSNAGCITYVELGSSAKENIEALEKLVVYAMDKDLPYFAVNVPVDCCLDCGYEEEINTDNCPICGGDHIERLRRVTGYLTGDYKTAFNKGKQAETEDRFKHGKITKGFEQV